MAERRALAGPGNLGAERRDTTEGLTEKGRRIAAYIVAARLPDGGRGFSVLGATIDASTGHAFESRCLLGCPPRNCTAHGPAHA